MAITSSSVLLVICLHIVSDSFPHRSGGESVAIATSTTKQNPNKSNNTLL